MSPFYFGNSLLYYLCRRLIIVNFKDKKMQQQEKVCLVCKRNEEMVPLVRVDYKKNTYWICPQHIPVLIHDPGQLEGLLPDAGNLQAG